MKQWRLYLNRLAKPSVLISIASQVVTILMLFRIEVDMTVVAKIITSVCSILVLLGVVSDPNSKHKGYQDDLMLCKNCGNITPHVEVGGEMMCKGCGGIHETHESLIIL